MSFPLTPRQWQFELRVGEAELWWEERQTPWVSGVLWGGA